MKRSKANKRTYDGGVSIAQAQAFKDGKTGWTSNDVRSCSTIVFQAKHMSGRRHISPPISVIYHKPPVEYWSFVRKFDPIAYQDMLGDINRWHKQKGTRKLLRDSVISGLKSGNPVYLQHSTTMPSAAFIQSIVEYLQKEKHPDAKITATIIPGETTLNGHVITRLGVDPKKSFDDAVNVLNGMKRDGKIHHLKVRKAHRGGLGYRQVVVAGKSGRVVALDREGSKGRIARSDAKEAIRSSSGSHRRL